MPHLALFLLGPPRLERDGEPVQIGRRKAVALLAYLALQGGRHSRDALAALLWPDFDQSGARAELRRSLSVLNRALGKGYLSADRETAGLNTDVDPTFDSGRAVWVDVDQFRRCLGACEDHEHGETVACPDCLAQLTQAVGIYRDDFLAGFSLPDSLPFDEWQRFQAQTLRDELATALERLALCHSALGEYERAIVCARRWLDLDPTHEPAHRQLMRLYAEAGRRGAALRQYRACVRILETELGGAPAAETTALYERLAAQRVGPAKRPARPATAPPLSTPRFLDDAQAPRAIERAVFVAREGELARLHGFLAATLAGQGQVAFVIGGPGRGKTALMGAFARQAMQAHPGLLVASGACNAFSGVGDPYLPFREALAMLSGDVETRWSAGAISTAHARRLWSAVPDAARALLDHGPYLIETMVPGAGLLSRATVAAGEHAPWLAELQSWVARDAADHSDLEQRGIFEQYTNVLCALASRHPLLLALDDLQWADNGSVGLLFHLGRRLAGAGSPVLIVGAYRPEEVAAGRGGEPHPLERLLTEFQRIFGDVWLDLTRTHATHSRRFVEALLDTQSNRLAGGFRNDLHERTGGHALFTVELLLAMQERGDLVRDADGAWVEGAELDWGRLPARVDAVVKARVERLDEASREMLTVSSVEGERFTAQVIAQVLQTPEREVIRALSRELGAARHRLVHEDGELQTPTRFLSRYRFAHALFQAHVYNTLSAGERRLLHGEVGAALEALYGTQTDEIAAALAHHFFAAGRRNKAVEYALRAGDQARRAFANEEALAHYESALQMLGPAPGPPGQERVWRLEALKGLGRVYLGMGRTPEAESRMWEAIALGKQMGLGAREIVRLYWWLGETLYWQDQLDAVHQNAQDGLALLGQEADSSDAATAAKAVESVEGALMCGHLALAHWGKGNRDKYGELARRIAAFILRLPYAKELRTAYSFIARASVAVDKDVDGAMSWLQALEERAAPVHDLRALVELNSARAGISALHGDLQRGISHNQQALEMCEKTGDGRLECLCLAESVYASFFLGDIRSARDYAHKWLEAAQAVGNKRQLTLAYLSLGRVFVCQKEWEKAERAFQRALEISRGIGLRAREDTAAHELGYLHLARSERGKAIAAFQQAVALAPFRTEFFERPLLARALSGLEKAYADPPAFRAFCRRFRETHPEMAASPLDQWFLEPATPGTFRDAPGQHERFVGPSPLGWVWEDPLGDCSFCTASRSASEADTLGNGLEGPAGLSSPTGLEVRAANGRDLWHVNLSAPRLLRPAPQGTTHWAVQTCCGPCSNETPAIGGLLLWKDKRNYLRLDRGTSGAGEITFQGCLENKDLVIGRGWLRVGNAGGGELGNAGVWLRLERIESRVRALCSPDGENWFTPGEVDFPVDDPIQVGLHAIGWIDRSVYPGAHPDGTAIRFESFQMWER